MENSGPNSINTAKCLAAIRFNVEWEIANNKEIDERSYKGAISAT
jgi:hypothetical protein